MTKLVSLSLFLGLQIILVGLYIYKESCYIQVVYEYQKAESLRAQLLAQRKQATHELQQLKNPLAIQEYAQKQLGMKSVGLATMRRINDQ